MYLLNSGIPVSANVEFIECIKLAYFMMCVGVCVMDGMYRVFKMNEIEE